jgi:hypothetical protein
MIEGIDWHELSNQGLRLAKRAFYSCRTKSESVDHEIATIHHHGQNLCSQELEKDATVEEEDVYTEIPSHLQRYAECSCGINDKVILS